MIRVVKDGMRLINFRRIIRRSAALMVIFAALLTVYIVGGRIMMSIVTGDASYFESRIIEYTGVPVSVDSLTGSFDGINPRLRVDGLRLLVGAPIDDGNASALVFDSATIALDVQRSLLERRWILEDFTVETLEIIVEQSSDGYWRLAGVDNGNGAALDLDELFQSLRRISYLNLRNVGIRFVTNQGATFSLANGTASIQNRGESHFLHIDANLGDSSRRIAFSFEVTGDELNEIDGQVFIKLPDANYSEPFKGQSIASFRIDELQGAGNFWINIEDGKFTRGITEIDLKEISLTGLGSESEQITFNDMSGATSIIFNDSNNAWNISLADMSLRWKNHFWESFNLTTSYIPSNRLSIQADYVDLAFISELFTESGFLSVNDGRQLLQYGVEGAFKNLSVFIPFEEAVGNAVILKSNIEDVEVNSVRGAPALWGLNGYIQASFNPNSKIGAGFAEVDSENFRINLPNIFTNVWQYDHVNGRLNFRVDFNNGQELELASSVIIAESDAIDGRVVFSFKDQRIEGRDREAEIELMVGASRADASLKTGYLPDGPNVKPNLRNSMSYLDKAIRRGDILEGGILYRGSSLPNANSNEKTFQSYFVLSDSEISFSEEWPVVDQMSGIVITDDNNVDLEVDRGNSLGIEIQSVSGEIRENNLHQNWVRLEGSISAETAEGLNYLENAPLPSGLTETLSSWETTGDFNASLNIDVPLDDSSIDTKVRVDLSLEENSLMIPEYSLTFNDLSGPIIFDTESGIERTELTGNLFSAPVELSIQSVGRGDDIQKVLVSAQGSASRQQLIDWPQQSDFVRAIIGRMEGDLPYSADLVLNQTGEQGSHFLNITSNLSGVSLNLPSPVGKYSTTSLPLNLDFEFGENRMVSGNVGEQLSFVLELQDTIEDGIVYFGDSEVDLFTLMSNDTDGVAILGNLDKVIVDEWVDFVTYLGSFGNQSTGYGNTMAFVDIVADVLEVYEQELPLVNIRIQEDSPRSFAVNLMGDSIQGNVQIPAEENEYLQIDLDYLHLEGEDEIPLTEDIDLGSSNLSISREETEREDPLLSIDPRLLPQLKFSTDEFSIGSRSYGSWSFSLNPDSQGATFDDLIFDFRGLRLGMEGPYVDGTEIDEYAARFAPSFTWDFDGSNHTSSLTGILYADNMADVLTANGYAASIESEDAIFFSDISWPGSPAYFAGSRLSGELDLDIDNGRFQQGSGGQGALRLISILNFDAIMRRARLSDDLVRTGFAYDEIEAEFTLEDGQVQIEDRLVISGPSSLYQITGELDLKEETILGEMFVTLPFSNNIPWLGLLTANLPLAFGAYLFDQIFGEQVDSLTSAVYTLDGPWEELEPEFKQAFGSPSSSQQPAAQ